MIIYIYIRERKREERDKKTFTCIKTTLEALEDAWDKIRNY